MGDNQTHSKLSWSSASRWMKCSGSVFMALAYPETGQSEYAAEGTRAHAVAERILTHALTEGCSVIDAWKLYKHECDDDEMREHVLGYCETARGLLPLNPSKVAIERKFIFSEAFEMGGTADFCFLSESKSKGKVGVIVDLKYGAGYAVDVEGNEQLIGYLCSMHNDPDWGPLDYGVVYIFQPRAEHVDGPLRRMELSREDLDDWSYRFLARGKETTEELEAGSQKFVPGPWCRWCRGEAVCTANQNHLSVSAEIDFLPLVQEEPKDPSVLEPEKLVKILKYRPVIESYFKRVEEWLLEEGKAGRLVPGTKLVKGRAVRKWLSNEAFVAEKLKTMGVEPFVNKLRGITEVEKEVGKGKLAGITETPEPKLKIAIEEDARPSVELKQTEAEVDFEF